MLWFDNETGTRRTALQDFTPSLGYTVEKAARGAFEDNPVTMGVRWLQSLDNDPKLDANGIDDMIKASGVRDYTLESGKYSKAAATQLIERRRQKQIEQDVDARTDYTWGETPIRALVRAGVALADPLNLASMFIPPLGGEYFAGRMAAASGAAGRFGVRAYEGAVQGGIGMAALEAPGLALHSALHDDYSAADSLANIFMGAGLGAMLHGVGGILHDRVSPGNWKPGSGLPLEERPPTPIPTAPGRAVTQELTPELRAIERTERRRARLGDWRDDYTAEEGQAAAQTAIAQRLQGKDVDVGVLPPTARQRLDAIADELGVVRNETEGGFSQSGRTINIPAEDVSVRYAITPEHVYAHELGHAIMEQRGMSFAGWPKSEMEKFGLNYDELVAASQNFRPAIWESESAAHRAHTRKPNELLADAIGAVLLGDRPSSFLGALKLTTADLGMRTMSERIEQARTKVKASREQAPPLEGPARVAREEPTPEGETPTTPAQQAAGEAEKNLNDAVKNLADSGYVAKAIDLKPYDEAVADAGRIARALKAAATCMLRA